MRRFVLALMAAAIAGAAAATPNDLSFGEIEQRYKAQGYRILEIERYPSVVEVKGYDPQGVCVELHLSPTTGEILKRERDDDCYREDRRGRGRGRD